MLAPVRVTPPAATPVSVAEAKAHLRVDHSDDDALIEALVQAATDHLDGWSGILGRALVTQTWRVDLSRFPRCDVLRLPLSPIQSISSIAYWDALNTDQTFAAQNYSLHADARGALIALASSASWPGLYTRADAVRVTFVAGYGAPADVPAPIKQAILLSVGHMYPMTRDLSLSRVDVTGVGSKTWVVSETAGKVISAAADALLAPYRVLRV